MFVGSNLYSPQKNILGNVSDIYSPKHPKSATVGQEHRAALSSAYSYCIVS